MSVCLSVRRKKLNMISARDITGVASGYGNFVGPKFSYRKILFNFVPQFFHMFGDSVYAYHDNATRKNVGLCPLPGSWSTKSLVLIFCLICIMYDVCIFISSSLKIKSIKNTKKYFEKGISAL